MAGTTKARRQVPPEAHKLATSNVKGRKNVKIKSIKVSIWPDITLNLAKLSDLTKQSS